MLRSYSVIGHGWLVQVKDVPPLALRQGEVQALLARGTTITSWSSIPS